MAKELTDKEIYAARDQLWRIGNLEWKLSPPQLRMYKAFLDCEKRQFIVNAGRRVGKSYWLCILALQQCIKEPKSNVKFFQPEKGQVKTNIIPVMNSILEDCPVDVRPKYNSQTASYVFTNGSTIQLGGTDKGNHEKLRGTDAHLCLIDEAGFLQAPLDYLIKSILGPSTMRTFGKIVMSSSTPSKPDHEFVKYMERARMNGAFFSVTSKQAMEEHEEVGDERFTREMYYSLAEQYPMGEEDDDFKRECLNELIVDGSNSIIPEFTNEIEKEIIAEWAMPPYCDRYVAMDVGFRDLTVALFGFYDFQHDTIVIQDELVMNGPEMTTDVLASEIFKKERELWTSSLTGELMDPHKRVSDNNNLTLLNDLNRLYGLHFTPTEKKDKEAHINNLRVRIANFQVAIDPRCKTLIHHIKFGTWDKQRRNFGRGPDGSHYDALDALIYFVRNVDFGKNPFPRGYRLGFLGPEGNLFIKPGREEPENDYSEFKRIFSTKKKG